MAVDGVDVGVAGSEDGALHQEVGVGVGRVAQVAVDAREKAFGRRAVLGRSEDGVRHLHVCGGSARVGMCVCE